MVSNAGRRQHDQRLMERATERLRADGKDVNLRFLEPGEQSLLALQGPGAAAALQPLAEGLDLAKLYFMRTALCRVAGQPCRVTRCGYTGEDGVEISVASAGVRAVAEALLGSQAASVQLAGLGARDSLRLEAGLCLYGNDIDVSTTPVEAGLTWLVGQSLRTSPFSFSFSLFSYKKGKGKELLCFLTMLRLSISHKISFSSQQIFLI